MLSKLWDFYFFFFQFQKWYSDTLWYIRERRCLFEAKRDTEANDDVNARVIVTRNSYLREGAVIRSLVFAEIHLTIFLEVTRWTRSFWIFAVRPLVHCPHETNADGHTVRPYLWTRGWDVRTWVRSESSWVTSRPLEHPECLIECWPQKHCHSQKTPLERTRTDCQPSNQAQ